MIDINFEAEKTLKMLGRKVVYQHPDEFTALPAVSFYNVTERGALYCDNEESLQSGYVQIDVWAREPMECGEIAVSVNEVMTRDGWTREMSADVPEKDGGIYHKTMRFHKYFNV